MPDVLLVASLIISGMLYIFYLMNSYTYPEIESYTNRDRLLPGLIPLALFIWFIAWQFTPNQIDKEEVRVSGTQDEVDILVTNEKIVNLNEVFGKDFIEGTPFKVTYYKDLYIDKVGVLSVIGTPCIVEELTNE